MTTDRTELVPLHHAKNVLPNSPLYTQLLRLAHRDPQRTIINDVNLGGARSRIQLLNDVLELQEELRHNLSESVFSDLASEVPVFIAILAPGGYEYTVAVLAALALGAAVVPVSEYFERSRCLPYVYVD